MALTNEAINNILLLLLNNTAWANIGDASGLQPSGGAGSFYLSLHTADPGATGNQTTSEATYTSYARVAVARSGAGWTVSGTPAQASNTSTVNFAASTGGTNVITYVGLGTASAGNGHLIMKGALNSSRTVNSGDTPSFAAGALVLTAA